MYRWVTQYDHLADNITRGWLATTREMHLSVDASERLVRALGEHFLEQAGYVLMADGCLHASWDGLSFTTLGPKAFAKENLGIFGAFGLKMSRSWMTERDHVRVEYLADTDEDLARLVAATGAIRTSTEFAGMLRRFERSVLADEREVRVFCATGSRVAFAPQHVVQAIVSSHEDASRLREVLPYTNIHVIAPADLPDLSADLFTSRED